MNQSAGKTRAVRPRDEFSPLMTTTSEVTTPAKRPVEPPIKAPTRQSRLPWLQLVGLSLCLASWDSMRGGTGVTPGLYPTSPLSRVS